MWLDFLHLARTLRRSPASAAAAILTLTLTLGAGASIFAVVDAVLLTPLPFKDPDALVTIGEVSIDGPASAPRAVSYATFEAWRARLGARAALEAFDGTNLTLSELGPAERVNAIDVTPAYLTLLGVTPALGRGLVENDIGQRVALVSDAFWRRKLGGDPHVIGRHLVLGGQRFTIVGVLPETPPSSPVSAIWRPMPLPSAQAVRTGQRVGVIARLAPGVSAASVAQSLDEISHQSVPPARAVVTPLATARAGDAAKTVRLLGAAGALAMLIAFTNLAGLLMVRSIDRRRELAVRTALGASRLQVARQVLLEAQALVTIGVAGGAVLAFWLTPAIVHALEQFGGFDNRDITVNWRVIGVLAVLASICAWMCAALPALAATRRNTVQVLRRGATSAPGELRVRRTLVTAEVALAFVLLVSVTLLGRSLYTVLRVNPGFDPAGVLTLAIALPSAAYNTNEPVVAFQSSLLRAIENRLGPRSVGIIDELPLTGHKARIVVSRRQQGEGREAAVRAAGAGYFEVMRIPIVAGRVFDQTDSASVPPRLVVSESFARAMFGGEPAVGGRVWLQDGTQTAEIIGVVGEVKNRALDDGVTPTVYVSAMQVPSRGSIVVVRSTLPDADVIAVVRDETARLDRDLPVYGVRPMQEFVAISPGMPAKRVLTAAFTASALLAVLLAAIGLFGVVAHDVASRRPELALRIALGANPARIVAATLAQGALMVGAGALVGGILSVWAARALGAVIVTHTSFDVVSVTVAAAATVGLGVTAVLPVARRAARTDPVIALRSE